MPNPFGSSRYAGSANWGADRIRRLLDLEERGKRARRSVAGTVTLEPEEPSQEIELEHPLGTTDWAAQQFRRLMNQEDEAKQVLTAGVPQIPRTGDENEFDYVDALSDWISGQYERHLDYVAARGTGSEAVASQLPGRERGPADAYRHILWAAEMTRRFGEQRAREILALHERDGGEQGQMADERAMDVSNNEIGIQIGVGARTFDDVVSATRKAISGSAEDGSGAWKTDYDPTSTMAPQAAQWLSEERWAKNPRFEVARRYPFPAPSPQEMPTRLTNWHSNPIRPDGPDWDDGYVPDNYSYPYGGTQHATGPNDPAMLRARNAYRFLVDRPWLLRLMHMR